MGGPCCRRVHLFCDMACSTSRPSPLRIASPSAQRLDVWLKLLEAVGVALQKGPGRGEPAVAVVAIFFILVF
jgi:hypothetical protein